MENDTIQGFELTFALDTDLQTAQFAVSEKLIDAINLHVKLSDYCPELTKFVVVMQCFAPDNEFVKIKQRHSYKRKTKQLELYLILNHAAAKQADKPAMLKLLSDTYILGIRKVLRRKNFNKKKLLEAITARFAEVLEQNT